MGVGRDWVAFGVGVGPGIPKPLKARHPLVVGDSNSSLPRTQELDPLDLSSQ